jgi:hypothetical protein
LTREFYNRSFRERSSFAPPNRSKLRFGLKLWRSAKGSISNEARDSNSPTQLPVSREKFPHTLLKFSFWEGARGAAIGMTPRGGKDQVLRISAGRSPMITQGPGVAGRDRRHDRAVGDALVFHSIDPQLRVHDLILS